MRPARRAINRRAIKVPGAWQLLVQPALSVGQGYQQADTTDGCFMPIEAQYQ